MSLDEVVVSNDKVDPNADKRVAQVLAFDQIQDELNLVQGDFKFTEGFFSGKKYDTLNGTAKEFLRRWTAQYRSIRERIRDLHSSSETEDVKEVIGGIGAGVVAGLGIGIAADAAGLAKSPIAEGLTRIVAGNGDSIGGYIATRKQRSSIRTAMRGALVGTGVAIGIHALVYAAYSILGTEIPPLAKGLIAIAYSNGDNWGQAFGGLYHFVKREGDFWKGAREFLRHPYHAANIAMLTGIAAIEFGLRGAGVFDTTNNTQSSIEGAALNIDSLGAGLIAYSIIRWRDRELQKELDQLCGPDYLTKLYEESKATTRPQAK